MNNTKTIEKKNKKNKCYICNKKINIVQLEFSLCNLCDHNYCLLHRLPENHECNYNYLNDL